MDQKPHSRHTGLGSTIPLNSSSDTRFGRSRPQRPSAQDSQPQLRSQSVSGPNVPLRQQNARRPSAPNPRSTHNAPLASTRSPSPPRLSIADRFMSPNYKEASVNSPTVSQPTQQQTLERAREYSVSRSSDSSYRLNHTESQHGRPSIADRFMGTSWSSGEFSKQHAREAPSSGLKNSLSSDTDRGRLTITETFGRSHLLSTTDSTAASNQQLHGGSLFDEVDLGIRSTKQDGEIHPLDTQSDGQFRSHSLLDLPLRLDLSLSSPRSTIDGRTCSRPFGSQDTLVHKPGYGSDRKRSVYSQYMDSEKESKHDRSLDEHYYDNRRSFSLGDYYAAPPGAGHGSSSGSSRDSMDDGRSSTTRHGYDENDWSNHKKHVDDRWRSMSNEEQGKDTGTKGMWIGCCFFACGKRPNQYPIIDKAERSRQKNQKQQQQQHESRGRGRCGGRCWVFGSFILLILLVVTGYILWPRTPLMRIEGASLLSPAVVTETHQGVMVGNVAFESQWLVNVTVDNRQNHVPTRLIHIQVLAKDALTGMVIGKGVHNQDDTQPATVLPPDTISTIQLPIALDYQARDASDATFANLRKACTVQPPKIIHDDKKNQTITEQPQRESLQLHFWITLHFFGLDWLGYKPTVIATPATGGFACPLS